MTGLVNVAEQIEQYRYFEISIDTAARQVRGTFSCGDIQKEAEGFFLKESKWTVRFCPERTGRWDYRITDGEKAWEGAFTCVEARGKNHGRVRAEGFHFRYEDKTRYLPFGTTCYAWIYQPEEIRAQTLKALAEAPFNKLRMCIFPKDMIYNEEEPPFFPYEKDEQGKWDIGKPVPEFWETLERCILELDGLGIEADLILFHPYDRWGFSRLPAEDNRKHLKYCVTRLAAFKNLWWSLANEYDLMPGRMGADWDSYARLIRECDPYGHLLSIHNCFGPYEKREWMTHCSLQTADTKSALEMRMKYGIPVILDECGYEGDIPFDWGNLSAFELTHRIWMGCMRGGYCSHGETLYAEDNRLWWSKGGRLRGESVARIAFLKGLLEELPENLEPFFFRVDTDPNGKKQEGADTPFAKAMMGLEEEERNRRILDMLPLALCNEGCWLQYLGRSCQREIQVNAPGEGSFRADILDVWEMRRVCAASRFEGSIRLKLPGKEGTAILLTRLPQE